VDGAGRGGRVEAKAMTSVENKFGADVEAKVPDAFADKTLDRIKALPLPIQLYN
jgi:hypothetical protein